LRANRKPENHKSKVFGKLILHIGQSYLKLDLHRHFGGNPRAGIAPTRSGQVLIFSDPPSGTRFGYDENDAVVGSVYRYTGEGQVGDQTLIRGNKALVFGRELLLFKRVDSKSWMFVGEVALDATPFETARAVDRNGKMRTVLVFRFIEKNANFDLLKAN
jgi:5-methylcytosine-specific restriction protein A